MKTIKQMLLTVAALMCSVAVHAYDFEVDGMYYKIISLSELTVEVTYGDNKYEGEVVIPSTVTYKSKTLNVTGIGSSAFEDCSSLSCITIPNSVTSIGNNAFEGCCSLKNLCIENGEKSLSLGDGEGDPLFNDCPLETLYLGRTLEWPELIEGLLPADVVKVTIQEEEDGGRTIMF